LGGLKPIKKLRDRPNTVLSQSRNFAKGFGQNKALQEISIQVKNCIKRLKKFREAKKTAKMEIQNFVQLKRRIDINVVLCCLIK